MSSVFLADEVDATGTDRPQVLTSSVIKLASPRTQRVWQLMTQLPGTAESYLHPVQEILINRIYQNRAHNGAYS